MLILAGVTIATLTGDNGILTRTQDAKNRTEEAEREEKEKLGDMEDIIDEYAVGIKIEQVTDENPGVLEGTGTYDNPYTINSIEDLVFFSYDVNAGNTYEGQTVKLALSLDFNSNKSYVDPLRADYGKYGYDGELKTLLTTGEGFNPIGTYLNTNTSVADETNTPFMGTFDGDGHEIDGMRIVSEEKGKGLFGLVKSATIKNLGIGKNCIISAATSYGSITGYAYLDSRIEACYNKAEISSSSTNIAGIVGSVTAGCSVTDCYNIATINGQNAVGGIVGSNSGTISNCYNIAIINGESSAGGIAGENYGAISECYNSGDIYVDTTNAGGISGINTNGTISNCYNIATVTGTMTVVGGIVGNMSGDDAKISNSYNIGIITSVPGTGGGIVAAFQGGILENNYTLENIINNSNGYITSGISIKNSEELMGLANILGNAFKEDTNDINNGYPILNWQ